jgi:hypothetical protein
MSNRTVSKNFKIASSLIFIVFVLSVIYMFLPDIHVLSGMLPLVIATKVFILGLAILLRLGYSWSKFVLLALALLTLLGIGDILYIFQLPRLSTFLNLVQVVLVIWATVLVFRKQVG